MSIWMFRPIENAKGAFKCWTYRRKITSSRSRYTQLELSYDGLSTCRVFRQLHRTVLSKQRLVHANNDSKSSVAAVVPARCTTSRSALCLLVSQYPINIEERMITEDSEHIYHQLPSVQNQGSNQHLLLSWSSKYYGQTREELIYINKWLKTFGSNKPLRFCTYPSCFFVLWATLLLRNRWYCSTH